MCLCRPFFYYSLCREFLEGYYLVNVKNFRSHCGLVPSKVRRSLLPDVILFHHLVIMIVTVCLTQDCFHLRNKLYHI